MNVLRACVLGSCITVIILSLELNQTKQEFKLPQSIELEERLAIEHFEGYSEGWDAAEEWYKGKPIIEYYSIEDHVTTLIDSSNVGESIFDTKAFFNLSIDNRNDTGVVIIIHGFHWDFRALPVKGDTLW